MIEYYIMGIILLPAIIFACIAQAMVTARFNKYSKVATVSGLTARQVAESILKKKGILDVTIKEVDGKLTDYYDDKEKTIALSKDVINSTSVSAIGVATHEVGHAIQYSEGYFPIKMRMFMVRVSNLSSKILWPLVILGIIFNLGADKGSLFGNICLWAGIGFFGISILFNLVTLPVEYNASHRAEKVLKETGVCNDSELVGVKSVLSAAALTYVASLMVSIMNMLRFIIVIGGRKRE